MRRSQAYIGAVGVLSAHGATVASLIDALARGRVCPVREQPSKAGRPIALPRAGWIEPIPAPDSWSARRTTRTLRFGRLDRLAKLALVAAHQAAAAGDAPPAEESCGVVTGTAFGAHLTNERFQYQLEQDGTAAASPALFTYTLPSAASGEIAIQLGLKGAAMTLAQGLGAGLAAVASAADMVSRGEARWMLAGGVEVLSPTLLRACGGLDQTSPLAEGAAFVTVVQRPERTLARILGAGHGCGEDALRRVPDLALDRAGLTWRQLRSRLHLGFETSEPASLLRCIGQCFAAAPMLALCALLAGGDGLPALVSAADPQGGVDALCLASPDV